MTVDTYRHWTIFFPQFYCMKMYRASLTVRLLVASTCSRSTKLLGLAATRVSYQQSPIVLDQDVLDLFLGGLINICRKIKLNAY